MKIYSVSYIYLFLSCLIISGCKYDTDIPNPEDYVKIYMPQASEAPAKRTFTMADTAQTIIFGAAYGGPNYPSENIEISFKAEPNLVSQFNTQNGTSYEVLPANSYTFEKTTSSIQKGTLKSEPLKIKVKTNGFLEAFKQYLLPVSIEQLNTQLPINENLKTAYFLVEAQRDGIMLKIMSYGIKSGTVDMSAVAEAINTHNPDLLVVREIDYLTTRGSKKDLPRILSGLIGMPYSAYAAALDNYQTGQYGLAVYSKFPIIDSVKYMLTSTGSEKGPLAIVTVKINDQQNLIFAGTHLNSNEAIRLTQTNELLDIVSHYNTPLILAGNFNDKPVTGNTYVKLATQFSFPCTTCPPNFSKAAPATNSDMAMFKPSDRFRTISYSVGTTSTGDHLPIITQLQLFY